MYGKVKQHCMVADELILGMIRAVNQCRSAPAHPALVLQADVDRLSPNDIRPYRRSVTSRRKPRIAPAYERGVDRDTGRSLPRAMSHWTCFAPSSTAPIIYIM